MSRGWMNERDQCPANFFLAMSWRHLREAPCVLCDLSEATHEINIELGARLRSRFRPLSSCKCGGTRTLRYLIRALPDGYCLQRTELWRARWGENARFDESPCGSP